MVNVFVYGTLMFENILNTLANKQTEAFGAILMGHKRYAVKNKNYPAVIEEEHASVKGKVILNVDERTLKVLDHFEGDQYEKKEVRITSNLGDYDALIYIWKDNKDRLQGEWDSKRFEDESIEEFIEKDVKPTAEEFWNKK